MPEPFDKLRTPPDLTQRQPDAGNNPARHVYLDVCALCRPFDDQNQMCIRLETDNEYPRLFAGR